ncbi:MAG: hypothetical protein ACLGIR_05390 [Actinomycetes bacterium]
MGRRRLISILAATVVSVGLTVGPAAAAELAPVGVAVTDVADQVVGPGSASVEAGEDDLSVTVDPQVVADAAGAESPLPAMEAGASPQGPRVGEAAAPAPAPAPTAPATRGGSTSEGQNGVVGASGGSIRSFPTATTSLAGAPLAASLQQVPAASAPAPAANVMSPMVAETTIDAPMIAPPAAVAAPASPAVATAPVPVLPDLPEVPLALRVATAALVAATAVSWTLVRREV